MAARLRFAPSPTGKLHLGGMRTALFNYLWAKKLGGQLVLRIEDTDQARFVPGATEEIIENLSWAGIRFDEGPHVGGPHGPYIQSQRSAAYHHHADVLLQKRGAYRCFCTPERLEDTRKALAKRGALTHYDRRCLHLNEAEVAEQLERGQPFTLRLRVPEGTTRFEDLVHGRVEFANTQVDDQILLKSDRLPTYHLANVVDDHLMRITHVMRGEEWLSSTPKHLILYRLLGWQPPVFAHLPLLLNEDRTKLSKRHGNTDAGHYRQAGYLPEALVNFIALLGWNPKTTQEVFAADDLARQFSTEALNRAGSVVVRAKLDWFNKEHIGRMAQDPAQLRRLAQLLRDSVLAKFGEAGGLLGPHVLEDDYLCRVVLASKERVHLLREIAESFTFFFVRPDAAAGRARVQDGARAELLSGMAAQLALLGRLAPGELTEKAAGELLKRCAKVQTDAGRGSFKDAMWAARQIVTGSDVGPGVGSVMAVLGHDEVMRRAVAAVEASRQ